MVNIDLEAQRDKVLAASVEWAKSNKGYSKMRDLYVRYIEAMSNGQVNKSSSAVGSLLRRTTPQHIVDMTAPSLTRAQQRKLSVVLDKITFLLPKS